MNIFFVKLSRIAQVKVMLIIEVIIEIGKKVSKDFWFDLRLRPPLFFFFGGGAL